MKQNTISIPKAVVLSAQTMFHNENESLTQLVYFDRNAQANCNIELPLGKSLRGSITYFKDPSDTTGDTIAQQINFYRQNGKKYSTSIYDSRYSHVKVSNSRVTVSMSISLPDDPERLKARMQNFANIIIEESDEIAAMLLLEGTDKVQEAWELLSNSSLEDGSKMPTV